MSDRNLEPYTPEEPLCPLCGSGSLARKPANIEADFKCANSECAVLFTATCYREPETTEVQWRLRDELKEIDEDMSVVFVSKHGNIHAGKWLSEPQFLNVGYASTFKVYLEDIRKWAPASEFTNED